MISLSRHNAGGANSIDNPWKVDLLIKACTENQRRYIHVDDSMMHEDFLLRFKKPFDRGRRTAEKRARSFYRSRSTPRKKGLDDATGRTKVRRAPRQREPGMARTGNYLVLPAGITSHYVLAIVRYRVRA